jgi:hypothetical protein
MPATFAFLLLSQLRPLASKSFLPAAIVFSDAKFTVHLASDWRENSFFFTTKRENAMGFPSLATARA